VSAGGEIAGVGDVVEVAVGFGAGSDFASVEPLAEIAVGSTGSNF